MPTLEGPERANLLEGVRGTLVHGECGGELVVLSWPTDARRGVDLGGNGSIRGPDEQGRILYADNEGWRWRDLETGRQGALATSEGGSGPGWIQGASFVALAPRGGRVLVARRLFGTHLAHESAPGLEELFLLTIDDPVVRYLGDHSIQAAAWMPDGKHAVVEVWDRSRSEDRGPYPEGLENDPRIHKRSFETGTRPGLQVLDSETGSFRWIAWGRMPTLSPDGRRLLYALSPREPLRLRDLDTGEDRPIELPGFLHPWHWPLGEPVGRQESRCHGWLSDRIVVYDALPTAGQDSGYEFSYGEDATRPRWTLKAADIETGEFLTLVDSVGNSSFCSISTAYPVESPER